MFISVDEQVAAARRKPSGGGGSIGAHLGFAGGWGRGQTTLRTKGSRLVAAAASEVDGSSTSRVLDSGGSRSSIPAGSASISYGEGTVRFVERRRGELCEELVEGRPLFIASERGGGSRHGDHRGGVSERRRGKRGRRGLPGVMAVLWGVVARLEVVCTVVAACASLRLVGGQRRGGVVE